MPFGLSPIIDTPSAQGSGDGAVWRKDSQRQGLEETARLSDWPEPGPRNWAALVNAAQTEGELEALRRSVERACPFGDARRQKERPSG